MWSIILEKKESTIDKLAIKVDQNHWKMEQSLVVIIKTSKNYLNANQTYINVDRS